MSVWLTIPSKRPPEEAEPVLKQWRERGYKINLFCDSYADAVAKTRDAFIANVTYPGYARAVNMLIAGCASATVEWFIAAGDDVLPDPDHSAEEIARECELYFCAAAFGQRTRVGGTFGVMQPTGDRWGESPNHPNPKMRSAYIDRVCGSAWIGREFAQRVNKGNGPLWPEYFHMFVDEELQAVAEKLGVFWQRPDLTQRHNHWGRVEKSKTHPSGIAHASDMPKFLERANSDVEWMKAQTLFRQRQAAGFPGSELL